VCVTLWLGLPFLHEKSIIKAKEHFFGINSNIFTMPKKKKKKNLNPLKETKIP
jgi:hypothetical protein